MKIQELNTENVNVLELSSTRKYLKKVSKHLFRFEATDGYSKNYYQKLIINENGDKFTLLKFNDDLSLISKNSYNISDYEMTSENGKSYVPSELKNWRIFYRAGGYGENYKIYSVKHFKSIKEQILKNMS